MRVNPLPPQAYTKETLQKAYAWLLTQNSSVKEIAQDQNILVSLYLKAQRNGDAALDTPSIQNFKQELKSLASIMGDFQPDQNQVSTATSTGNTSHSIGHAQQSHASNPMQNQNSNSNATVIAQQTNVSLAQAQSGNSAQREKHQLNDLLDAKTMSAIFEVKEALNLGSDTEALRALVSLGMKQFKKFNI
ncbi:MAG: hypothetical protein ACK4VO_05700 [Pseudobdellovibrio sp.]